MKLDHTLDEVRPQVIINNLKKSDTWKIHLTITINLISSKDDNDEGDVVHSQRDNIEIMISDEADEDFDSLKNIYQSNLGSIVFDHVKLLYYKSKSWWIIYRFSWSNKKKQQEILSIKKVINVFNML